MQIHLELDQVVRKSSRPFAQSASTPCFPLFRLSLLRSFSPQPLAFSLILNVTVTFKMTGIVVVK